MLPMRVAALKETATPAPSTHKKSSQPTARSRSIFDPSRKTMKTSAKASVTAEVMKMVLRKLTFGWSKFEVCPAGGASNGTSHGISAGLMLPGLN